MTRIYMFLKQLSARCSLHSSSKRQWHADNSPPPTTNFNYPPSFNRLVLTACCSTSAWSDYANSWSDDVASSQDTDTDSDGDGVNDSSDAFPLDANEIINTDLDGIGNNTAHACPLDHTETVDADGNVINFTNSTMFVFNNCIVDSATFSLPPSRTPTLKSKPDAKPRESTKPLKCSWMTSMMFLSPRWSSKWGFSMEGRKKRGDVDHQPTYFFGRPNFQKRNIRISGNPHSQTNFPCPGKLRRTPNLCRVIDISIFRRRQTIIGCQYLDLGQVFALECVATEVNHQAYRPDIAPRRHCFAAKTN